MPWRESGFSSALAGLRRAALDQHGYLLLPGALTASEVALLRAAFGGPRSQERGTQHVHVTEETVGYSTWQALRAHPWLLAAASHVLGASPRVGVPHGRNPLPGHGAQGLHADWGPRERGEPYSVLTALFLLDDFSTKNGATRVVPGSHELPGPVPKRLAQPGTRHPEEVLVLGSSGSVLLFNGHLWHAGGQNRSDSSRRAVQLVVTRAGATIARSDGETWWAPERASDDRGANAPPRLNG